MGHSDETGEEGYEWAIGRRLGIWVVKGRKLGRRGMNGLHSLDQIKFIYSYNF